MGQQNLVLRRIARYSARLSMLPASSSEILNHAGGSKAQVIEDGKPALRGGLSKCLPLCWVCVILFLFILEPLPGGTPSTSDGAPVNTSSQIKSALPFVVIPLTKWSPTRPKAEAATGVITLVLMIALPCGTAAGLRIFFKKTKALGRPPGWGRLAIGNALVLVFLLSVMHLAGDTVFRFFVDTTDSLGFTKICERWVARHWRTNTAGCRDNIEYAPWIQPGKRRLTFVGDSFTAGHGIKDVEARFANRLRAAHPDWEVHVLANVGLDTGAEINVLKKAFFRGYQLDEVVLVYCLNDVGDLLLAPGEPLEHRLPSVEQIGPWFTRGSYFLDLYYNRYKAAQNPYVKDYFSFVKDGYRGRYWEAQKARLKEFRHLVQSHGGHLSVVTFPFLHALGPHYDYLFVHEELSRVWKELNVPQLDLLPVYAGLSPREVTVNAHDAHPNERAHRLAADAIDLSLWPVFTNHVRGGE